MKTLKKIKKFVVCILVENIVRNSANPETQKSEKDFLSLQNQYSVLPEYPYDFFNNWKRAASRSKRMIEKFEIFQPGKKILDVGCGEGMLGVLLNSYGHLPHLVDIDDWRDPRAKHLPFYKQDSEHMRIFESNQFDVVCSFNSFEHFTDPSASLDEMIRVCKPGGFLFLEFAPIYPGPWGLHAYSALKMPYPQHLFSNEFINSKIEEIGLFDLGKKTTTLQPLNNWSFSQYKSLLTNHKSLQTHEIDQMIEDNYLDIVLKYPKSFQGRNLNHIELVTHGITAILRKA